MVWLTLGNKECVSVLEEDSIIPRSLGPGESAESPAGRGANPPLGRAHKLLAPSGPDPPCDPRFGSLLPPQKGAGPSSVPRAGGYLEPAPGPASWHRSRSRAATSAATAATAPALSAVGSCIRASLLPRGSASPRPRLWAPLPDPPWGSAAATPMPTRLLLPGDSAAWRPRPAYKGGTWGKMQSSHCSLDAGGMGVRACALHSGQGMRPRHLQDSLPCVLLHPLRPIFEVSANRLDFLWSLSKTCNFSWALGIFISNSPMSKCKPSHPTTPKKNKTKLFLAFLGCHYSSIFTRSSPPPLGLLVIQTTVIISLEKPCSGR